MSEERICRNCGIRLMDRRDWRMGICGQCVSRSHRKTVSVPSPGYGFRHEQPSDEIKIG